MTVPGIRFFVTQSGARVGVGLVMIFVFGICLRERRRSSLVRIFGLLEEVYLDNRQTMGEAGDSFA